MTTVSLKNWKSDLGAGFVVFLVALPLCLGIALASNAPIIAGLISAIVAGIVVSLCSGSELSVSGPAAGMSVVVAAGIASLGSWTDFLAATVIAGMIQIVMGKFRGGTIAAFFPNSVIKGMLAAIGLTLIFKQIPHAVGWDVDYEGDESFVERFGESNTFQSLFESIGHYAPSALVVSFVAVVVMFAWGSPAITRIPFLAKIPASLLAVVSGVLVNAAIGAVAPAYYMGPESGHLVSIPKISSFGDFFANVHIPGVSEFFRFDIWTVGVTLAIIASLETLLSLEAVDRMDPLRRTSNGNRELVAQGIGNIVSGLLGGLIMTSVIVRSSANVYAGGKSRLSSFFHGLFMLFAVLFFAKYLNQIPLAALAIVLIFVGFKLISPAVIKSVWNLGSEQFIPFAVTIVAVVFTNLLTGVAIGLAVALLIIFRMNHHQSITVVVEDNLWLVRFSKNVSFAHKYEFKNVLAKIPDGTNVVIDGAGSQFIDQDILEEVRDFVKYAPNRSIQVKCQHLRSQRFSLRGKISGKLQEPTFSE